MQTKPQTAAQPVRSAGVAISTTLAHGSSSSSLGSMNCSHVIRPSKTQRRKKKKKTTHTHTLTTIPGSRSEGCELRTSVFRSTRLSGDNGPRYDLEAPSLSDHINRSIALHSDLSQTSARTHSKTNRPLSVNADRQTDRGRRRRRNEHRSETQRSACSVFTRHGGVHDLYYFLKQSHASCEELSVNRHVSRVTAWLQHTSPSVHVMRASRRSKRLMLRV